MDISTDSDISLGSKSQGSLLDGLRIASPCPKLWSDMELTGEDSRRFCGDCKKNVYDVSKMSRTDAELMLQQALAQQAEGSGRSLCLQLYRRADGTVITDDCPVGLRRVRDSWRLLKQSAASFAALVLCQIGLAGLAPRAQAQPDMRAGGLCPAVDWEAQAVQNPEIKRLTGELKALDAKPKNGAKESKDVVLQRCKLHLALGKEGDKCQLPIYARPHYQIAMQLVNGLEGEEKLKSEIQTSMAKNAKLLGISQGAAVPGSGGGQSKGK